MTCQRAKITGLPFRDLRRQFACDLIESGATLLVVRDFLGHVDIEKTNTYLSTTTAHQQSALDK